MPMIVPEYKQQFRYESPQVPAARLQGMNVQTNAAMFGGESGRQLEKAGYLVQRGADQLSHLVDDYNTTKARDAASKMQQGFLEWQSEAQKKQGEAGMNTAADYDTWAKTKREELTKGLSDVQRGRFEMLAGTQMASQRHWASGYGQQQEQTYKKATWQAEISVAADTLATNIQNPELAGQAMEQIKDAAFTMGQNMGIGEKATQELMRTSLQKALVPAIHARIQSGETGLASALMQQYGGSLGGTAMAQLGAELKRERKRQEAEARANATLRRMEARQLASLAPDQLAYGAQTNDFTAVQKTAAQLESMGATAEAADLRGSIQVRQTANTVIQGLRGIPLREQEAEAKKSFGDLLHPGNAREVASTYAEVQHTLKSNQAAFIKDPAAYALQVQPLDPSLPMRERIQRNLDTQQELGKGLDFTPQLLPKAQSLSIKNTFDAASDSAQKLQMVRDLQQDAGEFFPQLAREAKLPDAVVQLAPILSTLPDRIGGALVTASEMRWEDIPKGDDENTKANALKVAADSSLAQVYTGLFRALPQDSHTASFAKHMEETLGKAVLMGVNLDALDSQYSIVNDSNVFVALPKEKQINMDDVSDAIQLKRADVQRLTLPKDATSVFGQDGHLARLWQDNMGRLATDGLWVSDSAGENVYLLDPNTGRQVPDADGDPVRIRLADLEKYQKRAQEDWMRDMQDPATEGIF